MVAMVRYPNIEVTLMSFLAESTLIRTVATDAMPDVIVKIMVVMFSIILFEAIALVPRGAVPNVMISRNTISTKRASPTGIPTKKTLLSSGVNRKNKRNQ